MDECKFTNDVLVRHQAPPNEPDRRSKVYNYWNSLNLCKDIKYSGPNQAPQEGKTDVWPEKLNNKGETTPKLVKTSWDTYEKGE